MLHDAVQGRSSIPANESLNPSADKLHFTISTSGTLPPSPLLLLTRNIHLAPRISLGPPAVKLLLEIMIGDELADLAIGLTAFLLCEHLSPCSVDG